MTANDTDRPVRLLHLSDIHFRVGTAWDADPVLRALAGFVRREARAGLAPDLVAVTGDLAFAGKPNPWGLFDSLGNVFEWVADPWHPNYEGAPDDGSVWESSDPGAGRVIRDGSWDRDARRSRCAYRTQYTPDDRSDNLGFRCARGP